MDPLVVGAAFTVGAAALLVPIGLTATGQRRRGRGIVLAIAAGLFFPITWAVWYLRDEHPYRTTRRA